MKPKTQKQKKTAPKSNDDWRVVGWINANANGKTYTVSEIDENGDSTLLGFANAKTLDRMANGEISGCPIKMPVSTPEDEN